MTKVKLAVIGTGGMGAAHIQNILKIDTIDLTALCDVNAENVKRQAERYQCRAFSDYRELLKSKIADAVLIATPHYFHTTIGVAALQAGLHVLVEKPISVHKADCQKLLAAYKSKKTVFAAMFNQRTDPIYKKLKWLVDSGEIGPITRVNWIITTWFRTQAYYNSGSWRATWQGEGGGVLLNQCPHQLDLLQWICGMPSAVTAFCQLGRFHNIEVEDAVTAYLEYPNGATGVFITSTGETPGTNRLEITADRGKVVLENNQIQFTRTEQPVAEFCKTSKEMWGTIDAWNIDIPALGAAGQHAEIIRNFADVILNGKKLIAPAVEGIHSVELANAMLYSSLTQKTVKLPLDGKAYEKKLKQLIKESAAH